MSSRTGKGPSSSGVRRKTTASKRKSAETSSSAPRTGRPAPAQSDPSDYDEEHFLSAEAATNWPNFLKGSVMMEKTVVVENFHKARLQERFSALGWDSILHVDRPCYEQLVRRFYCNLEVSYPYGEFTISSLVKGGDIQLTVGTLASILGISAAGHRYYSPPQE